MIEIFKGWISSMLCIGIVITFIQLIVPKTNLKKYIYSLIGIITILTLVSPMVSLIKNKEVEESVTQVIANIEGNTGNANMYDEKYQEKTENVVREAFAQNMKKDIINKLSEKGINSKSIDIFMTEQYNIEKIKICIEKINKEEASIDSVTNVIKYINEEYDLDFSKIEVIEDGD